MIQIDIEMPKTCGQCFCAMEDYDYNTVRCRFKYDLCFEANSRDYSNRRLDGCPLHEVTVTDTDTISRPQTCEYCHEDSNGYVKPIEKNCHAFVRNGMNGWTLSLKANGWHGEASIKFCPMCGRKL